MGTNDMMAAATKLRFGQLHYRAGVAVRFLAGVAGGYALSALLAAALALWLPLTRVEAALTATMTALVAYPCAVMWCFATRSAWRATWGMAAASALPGALVLLSHLRGGQA
jgi:hypothetical protein